MKTFLLAFLLLASTAFAGLSPVYNLAEKLSKNASWQDGRVPLIQLPPTAKHTEVIEACLKANGLDAAALASLQINEVQEVQLPGGVFLVASCKTNAGRKLVVFSYAKTMWWTRVYDEKDYVQK